MKAGASGLVEQAWALRNHQRAEARAAARAVLADAASTDHDRACAQTLLAYLDYRERAYAHATAAGLDALDVLERDPADPWLPRLYNTLAIIYFDLGERAASRHFLDRQIRLSRELGDALFEALGYHDVGLLQAAVEPRRGLRTLAHARALFQANRDAENEALTLYNMANIHMHAGDSDLAARFTADALQCLADGAGPGEPTRVALHAATLQAEIDVGRGRVGEAQALLDLARELAQQSFPELHPHVQYCQGLHLTAIGDHRGALAEYQGALAQLGPADNHELLVDVHAALSRCYEQLGDYRAALAHHQSYAEQRERIFHEAGEEKVRALEIVHQVALARAAADAERQRNAELQRYIEELEQLQGTLRALSVSDPLTGLHNRRYLLEQAPHLLRADRTGDRDLCAAMLDIDHFKQINDTLGHAIGDLVLQTLATCLTQMLRVTDRLVRYGGEEFVLLLPETSLADAVRICERLRSMVEQYNWSMIHPTLQVTLSIGVAPAAGDELDALMARADAQLYRSKQSGRNRTTCAD